MPGSVASGTPYTTTNGCNPRKTNNKKCSMGILTVFVWAVVIINPGLNSCKYYNNQKYSCVRCSPFFYHDKAVGNIYMRNI